MKINESDKQPCFVKIKHKVKECKVKYQNAIELVKELGDIPNENEAVYIWLQGNFVFGDFLIQYISENEIDIDELTIITLSIGYENIEALTALIENGWVEKINFIVSGYFMRTEKKKHTRSIQMLEEATKNKNFKVFQSNTHQKVCLMKLKDGRKLVFHGSANMKGSQNYEQLMFENNSYLYDFNYEYFKNLINK
jgi:hypothetical protein